MAVPAVSPEPERYELETCRIARWRGYRWSTFVVVNADGEAAAESPSFRWRRAEDPPETDETRAALAHLVEELEAQGWRPLDEDDDLHRAWFALRLGRRVRATAPPVAAAPAPAPEPRELVERPRRAAAAAPAAPGVEKPRPQPAVPAAPAPPGRRRRRLALGGGVAALAAAAAAGAVFLLGQPAPARTSAAPAQPAAAGGPPAAARQTQDQQPRHVPTPQPAKTVRLSIATGAEPSWLEIRRGSATGPVVYSGDLPAGRHLQVKGARLWARFGAAGNLMVTVDGRRLPLSGTLERVFTPRS